VGRVSFAGHAQNYVIVRVLSDHLACMLDRNYRNLRTRIDRNEARRDLPTSANLSLDMTSTNSASIWAEETIWCRSSSAVSRRLGFP